MPRSEVKKKRLFREVSFLHSRYINKNYLKNLRKVRTKFCKDRDISFSHLEFILWSYDKEFWTINYAVEDYGFNKKNFENRILWPLLNEGYVYKHFDKLTPSATAEDHMFREETKFNYRVRYGITQKARMLIQAFYNRLED
tara:strand:- start:1784 stop:2206 length:423 start_codon:yes stop_codon:yes gene_type:complete